MTIINLTDYNARCYAVTFQNKAWIKVQKFEDDSLDKKIVYEVNPLETLLGKSESCEMTSFSGAFNKSAFDRNTILLKVSEECDKNRYLYFSGNMICTFLTDDNV